MSELAADGIPVTVTCWVLKLARQPYYRWLREPATAAEITRAYRADALFDAQRDDPQFGYRFLESMAERTAWRICRDHGWLAVLGKKKRKGTKPGPPAHDDLVRRDFSADGPTSCGWPTSPNTQLPRASSTCARSKTSTPAGSSGTRSATG